MRTLAIGDIHGCHIALQALVPMIGLSPNDVLVFLGDYIDRGPQSKEVVSSVLDCCRQGRAIALRGNHEVMLLAAREDPLKAQLWGSYGGDEALRSYGAWGEAEWQKYIPNEHWKFFEDTRSWFETETHIFVHATVVADLSMPDQPDYALYWERFEQQLFHISKKTVVCGHTPQRSGWPAKGQHSVCIDTGACSGGWLTCLDVTTGQFWQTNERSQAREGQLSSLP
jgi:serine/threonine protein phosphatase 1